MATERLASSLRTLREEMASNARVIRAEARRAKGEERKHDLTVFNARQRYVAAAIVELSGGDGSVAAAWLGSRCGKHGANSLEAMTLLAERAVAWHAELPPHVRQAMWATVPADRAPWLQCARNFLSEASVATWVRQENLEKGFAPPSRMVADRLEASARSLVMAEAQPGQTGAGPATDATLLRPPLRNTVHKRVSRWRQRWCGALRKVRARDAVSAEEVTQKARETGTSRKKTRKRWSAFWGPECGPRCCKSKRGDRFLDPEMGPRKSFFLPQNLCPQALAVWQWVNYLQTQVGSGKEPILVNLDETSVPFYHGDVKGNVVLPRTAGRSRPPVVQHVSRRELRACVTHVSLISNKIAFQQLLPQYILGNKSVLLVRDVRAVEPRLPPNLQVIRAKSGWTNTEFMVRVMRDLKASCERAEEPCQVILLMDCARQHLHPKVAQAAARNGIWLAFIPARLTWLMQPCDTHLFMAFKRFLRREYASERAQSPTGAVSSQAWLLMIARCVAEVVEQRDWAAAFAADGLTHQQLACSQFLLRHLTPTTMLPADSERPTQEMLNHVLPAGTRMSLSTLLRHVERVSTAIAQSDDVSPPPPEAEAAAGHGARASVSSAAATGSAGEGSGAESRAPPEAAWRRSVAGRMLVPAPAGPVEAAAPTPRSTSPAGPISRRTRSALSRRDRGS